MRTNMLSSLSVERQTDGRIYACCCGYLMWVCDVGSKGYPLNHCTAYIHMHIHIQMFIYVKCRYSLIITNNMLYICFLSSRSFVGVSWTQSKRRLSFLPSASQTVRPPVRLFACLFAAFVCIGSMFMVYGEWVLVSLSIDVAEYLSVYKSVFLCLCTSVYVQFYYIFLLCFFLLLVVLIAQRRLLLVVSHTNT